MRADETIAPQDCEHPIERKSLTLDERIKALNDIDQEFDNDVIRGFGEALNLIDELSEEIKNLLCVNAEQDRRANALRDSMEGKIKELETLIQDYVTANIGHVKHIAELESRQPKWISVDERFPTTDDYDEVLVDLHEVSDYPIAGVERIRTFQFITDSIEYDADNNCGIFNVEGMEKCWFTKWMRLPEAPTTEESSVIEEGK